jgi:hypothetical protein
MYKDFMALLPRWGEVCKDPELKKKFCNRNRNPLFDISALSYFKTKLGSEEGLKTNSPVLDHYIQRTKAVEILFKKLESEPKTDFRNFIALLKRLCSTVALTQEEHKKVTSYCKKNPSLYNFQAYEVCGCRVEGLSELLLEF